MRQRRRLRRLEPGRDRDQEFHRDPDQFRVRPLRPRGRHHPAPVPARVHPLAHRDDGAGGRAARHVRRVDAEGLPQPPRIWVSTKIVSTASARTTTSPGPGTGSGSSTGTRTSGPPYPSTRTARMTLPPALSENGLSALITRPLSDLNRS